VFGEELLKSVGENAPLTIDGLTVVRREYVRAGERGYRGRGEYESGRAFAFDRP